MCSGFIHCTTVLNIMFDAYSSEAKRIHKLSHTEGPSVLLGVTDNIAEGKFLIFIKFKMNIIVECDD